MTDFSLLFAFVQVVRFRSFSEASRQIGIPKSTLSRKISELEDHLGLNLMTRTTRKIHLSAAGQDYFSRCQKVIEQFETSQKEFFASKDSINGKIRVTAPIEIGNSRVAVSLATFMKNFPDIELEFFLTDQQVDIVGQGFDLAIRAGKLADSAFKAIKLGVGELNFYWSAELAKSSTKITDPNQVGDYRCIVFQATSLPSEWMARKSSHTKKIKFKKTPIVVNSFSLALRFCVEGLGIARLPDFLADPYVQNGKLIRVLPDWVSHYSQLSLVFPDVRYRPKAVSLLIDHLKNNTSSHLF